MFTLGTKSGGCPGGLERRCGCGWKLPTRSNGEHTLFLLVNQGLVLQRLWLRRMLVMILETVLHR